MTTSETAYILMVLAVFGIFSATLLIQTWEYDRSAKGSGDNA